MKYALIGCGRISSNHIEAAKNNKLNIVAICDLVLSKVEEKALDFELPDTVKYYTDYKKMLVNEKPELVAICTESGKHVAIALDCIGAGCNLIVEKPLALSIAGADAIISAGKEKGIKVCVCHQNRFNKSIQKVRDAYEKHRFGKMFYGVANIRWCRDWEYYSSAKWRGTWEHDGGALMNQSIHNIDLLRWMLGGEVDEVFAYTDNLNHNYIQAEDMGIALVKFKNGTYGIIEGTTNIYPKNLEETLCLFGKNGTVKVGGLSLNEIEEWNFSDALDDSYEIKQTYKENHLNIYGYGHTRLYSNVIDAIRYGYEPYITAEEGKLSLELVLAVYKSAAEGKSVKLPLQKCSTIDFLGRFENER